MEKKEKELSQKQAKSVQDVCMGDDANFFWEQIPKDISIEELAEFLKEFPDFLED